MKLSDPAEASSGEDDVALRQIEGRWLRWLGGCAACDADRVADVLIDDIV